MNYIKKTLPEKYLLLFVPLENHDEIFDEHNEYHIGPEHFVVPIKNGIGADEIDDIATKIDFAADYGFMVFSSSDNIRVKFVE